MIINDNCSSVSVVSPNSGRYTGESVQSSGPDDN